MLGLFLQVVDKTEEVAAAVPEAIEASGQALASVPFGELGAGLAAGLVAIGVGLAISRIGVSANESIARQPEAAAEIRGSSLILSALIEGVGLFTALVALLLALK